MPKYSLTINGKRYEITAESPQEAKIKGYQIKAATAPKVVKSTPLQETVWDKVKTAFSPIANRAQSKYDNSPTIKGMRPPDKRRIPQGPKSTEYVDGIPKQVPSKVTKYANAGTNYRPLRNATFDFPNVGQGSSILVQMPGGKKMLIDTGGVYENKGAGLDNIKALLTRNRIDKNNPLDYIQLTHGHEDHIGAAAALMGMFPDAKIITGGLPFPGNPGMEFNQAMKKRFDQRPLVMTYGDSLPLGPNARMDILNSPTPWQRQSMPQKIENESALASQIHYGVNSLVNMSDAKGPGMGNVLRSVRPADVVTAVEHGRYEPLARQLYQKIKPQAVIEQVGTPNKYNYPDDRFLSVLNQLGLPLYRSDLDGEIHVEFNGQDHKIQIGTER